MDLSELELNFISAALIMITIRSGEVRTTDGADEEQDRATRALVTAGVLYRQRSGGGFTAFILSPAAVELKDGLDVAVTLALSQ